MVIKKMQKTKMIIALAVVAVLTLAVVGLASAQIVANQTYAGTNPEGTANTGFWGWVGNCFGYKTNQPYGSQYVAPQGSADGSVPAPYQGGYGYGYGPCWTR